MLDPKRNLSKLLTPEEFNVATRYFGITEQGQLRRPQPSATAPESKRVEHRGPEYCHRTTAAARSAKEKMRVRAKRVRPHLDDKVLASWNGLMLGAMARAAAVLGDNSYRAAAERNLAFLQKNLWDAERKLSSIGGGTGNVMLSSCFRDTHSCSLASWTCTKRF